eukprot:MONOS_12516.1-p1 / transcript=MONOS_12516.1 / gene=MONOS_12516 / organism=Monocercomonoides_exilis_PA203 / gene_product=unspecified product / transcript_product=unspecified product / location=Mono_scaffold00697:10866-13385(-) / protein_length=840 / sequence_SO=supercontig / SO=protein_coding / is_pseudo=false
MYSKQKLEDFPILFSESINSPAIHLDSEEKKSQTNSNEKNEGQNNLISEQVQNNSALATMHLNSKDEVSQQTMVKHDFDKSHNEAFPSLKVSDDGNSKNFEKTSSKDNASTIDQSQNDEAKPPSNWKEQFDFAFLSIKQHDLPMDHKQANADANDTMPQTPTPLTSFSPPSSIYLCSSPPAKLLNHNDIQNTPSAETRPPPTQPAVLHTPLTAYSTSSVLRSLAKNTSQIREFYPRRTVSSSPALFSSSSQTDRSSCASSCSSASSSGDALCTDVVVPRRPFSTNPSFSQMAQRSQMFHAHTTNSSSPGLPMPSAAAATSQSFCPPSTLSRNTPSHHQSSISPSLPSPFSFSSLLASEPPAPHIPTPTFSPSLKHSSSQVPYALSSVLRSKQPPNAAGTDLPHSAAGSHQLSFHSESNGQVALHPFTNKPAEHSHLNTADAQSNSVAPFIHRPPILSSPSFSTSTTATATSSSSSSSSSSSLLPLPTHHQILSQHPNSPPPGSSPLFELPSTASAQAPPLSSSSSSSASSSATSSSASSTSSASPHSLMPPVSSAPPLYSQPARQPFSLAQFSLPAANALPLQQNRLHRPSSTKPITTRTKKSSTGTITTKLLSFHCYILPNSSSSSTTTTATTTASTSSSSAQSTPSLNHSTVQSPGCASPSADANSIASLSASSTPTLPLSSSSTRYLPTILPPPPLTSIASSHPALLSQQPESSFNVQNTLSQAPCVPFSLQRPHSAQPCFSRPLQLMSPQLPQPPRAVTVCPQMQPNNNAVCSNPMLTPSSTLYALPVQALSSSSSSFPLNKMETCLDSVQHLSQIPPSSTSIAEASAASVKNMT